VESSLRTNNSYPVEIDPCILKRPFVVDCVIPPFMFKEPVVEIPVLTVKEEKRDIETCEYLASMEENER
jgi:hypothetical protein